jgi:ABC-type multidrug transport system fused ATPase/permease subunit
MPIAMGLWDTIVWSFWFMLLVAWISLLIACVGDIFRDHELSSGKKALWVILIVVLPLLGTFIYMIARGDAMNRRAARERRESEEGFRAYVQDAAGGTSTAEELSKLADLRSSGAISQEDFERAKAKVLA